MMTVIEFKPEHLEKIRVKEVHSGEVPKTVMTRAVTVMDGELPIAIFGSFNFVPGVMHIWALVSEDVYKKPITFYRIVRNLLKFYETREKPRRIQIDIKSGHPELQKWAEAIGFKHEGIMRAYGANGEDFHLYGRVA